MDTSKTSKKRARQRNRHRGGSSIKATALVKKPADQQVPATDVTAEELLQSIASINSEENVSISTVNSSMEGEIFFADEIPTHDDIVVPFFNVVTSEAALNDGCSAAAVNITPNVIVEPVNCYLPTMDTFDENELNGLIDLNEQELIDRFLNDESGEIFVN